MYSCREVGNKLTACVAATILLPELSSTVLSCYRHDVVTAELTSAEQQRSGQTPLVATLAVLHLFAIRLFTPEKTTSPSELCSSGLLHSV